MQRTVLGQTLDVSRVGQGLGTEIDSIWSNSLKVTNMIKAIEFGVDVGLTFIDTAESYGKGLSEELVGSITTSLRKKIQVGTKFSSENSRYNDVIRAAESSLSRLKVEAIHLYQIHWPNTSVPMEETLAAMKFLLDQGKILNIGVCNFSKRQLRLAIQILGAKLIVSNQVEYNLFDRFIEKETMPFCLSNGIKIIAYSPLDKGRVLSTKAELQIIDSIAAKYQMTREQIALSWVLRNDNVLAIPASKSISHLRDNSECLRETIDKIDLETLSSLNSELKLIPPNKINVSESGEGNRKVYKTLEEALLNPFNMCPSPSEFAAELIDGEPIKPVRLIPSSKESKFRIYDLVEGRLRYWAWVIAFGEETPIPAYLRNSIEKEV